MTDTIEVNETKRKSRSKKAEEAVTTVVEDTFDELEAVEENATTALNAFLEHERAAIDSASKAFESLIPDGVRVHGKKAVEEMIEGYRVLFNTAVDEVIERVEKIKIPTEKTTDV